MKQKNFDYKTLLGKTIKIVSLNDTYPDKYRGRVGKVNSVEEDPWGDIRLMGDWGSIAIYPDYDKYEIMED